MDVLYLLLAAFVIYFMAVTISNVGHYYKSNFRTEESELYFAVAGFLVLFLVFPLLVTSVILCIMSVLL